MHAKVNISREYFVDLPFDETFSNLHKIVSSNFYNSKYCTFGNFVSPDPPEFVFMAKWSIIGKPFFSFMSTRVYAKLFKTDNKSKISVTTKSNPAIILVLIISVVSIMVSLFGYKTKDDLKLVGIFFLIVIGTLWFDRFIKKIVMASFETDMKLNKYV